MSEDVKQEEFNYEDDLHIDVNAIDEEFLIQPNLLWKYGKEQGRLKAEVDFLKERLEVRKSKISLQVRNDPESFGASKKLTESGIGDIVRCDESVRSLTKRLNETKHQLDILNTALTSLEAKGRSLEAIVKLMGLDYFTRPTVPSSVKTEIEKKGAERTKKNIHSRLNPKD
jgi:predicted RNase H-like nuclease (RuvC/YqgF family)